MPNESCVSIYATTTAGRIADCGCKRRSEADGCHRCELCRRRRCAVGRSSAGCTTSTASPPEHRIGCFSVSPMAARSVSEDYCLPASPCPRLCPPAEAWRPPGHPAACADDGRQAIIVGRIRPCVGRMSLAGSSDGVLAANRHPGSWQAQSSPHTPGCGRSRTAKTETAANFDPLSARQRSTLSQAPTSCPASGSSPCSWVAQAP
jgi:hypothetical protein